MIKEKMNVGQFPLKVKFKFRKKNIYLLPQGWQVQNSLSSLSYSSGGFYNIKHYLIPCEYTFTWLWFQFNFEVRKFPQSEQQAFLEPVKQVYKNSIS